MRRVCQRTDEGACSQCGVGLPPRFWRTCHAYANPDFKATPYSQPITRRERPDYMACVHLLGYTGESVKMHCGGCGGAKDTSVFGCEEFGLVAPLARVKALARADVRACLGCDSYQQEPSPNSQ